MLKKFLAGIAMLSIASITNAGNLTGNESLTSETSGASESLIDYRHMGLYNLKKNLYYNPAAFTEGNDVHTTRNEHTHHHDHWGWGGYSSPFWGWGHSSSDSDRSDSFTERVSSGLKEVAIAATVVAVAAAAAYTTTQVAFTLWPYMGAASLTAFELLPDSPWSITGYRIASGKTITHKYFSNNPDALEAAKEGGMFDRQVNNTGRFLLIDQENWWGLTDHPVDVDVTYTRSHQHGPDEIITVTFLRKVTNSLKAGKITAAIKAPGKQSNLRNLYSYSLEIDYPGHFEWRKWYHMPTRVVIDFHPVATY